MLIKSQPNVAHVGDVLLLYTRRSHSRFIFPAYSKHTVEIPFLAFPAQPSSLLPLVLRPILKHIQAEAF